MRTTVPPLLGVVMID